MGNYYTSNLNIDEAIGYYKKAINISVVNDHIYQFKLNLLHLYYNNDKYSDYTSLLNNVDLEKINSFQLKAKYEQLATVN